MEKLKLSMQEIAALAGEGLPSIYAAINAGDLKTFLVGRRRFARPAAVREWVDKLEKAGDAGRPVSYRPRSSEGAHA
jgi:hypothetical protein